MPNYTVAPFDPRILTVMALAPRDVAWLAMRATVPLAPAAMLYADATPLAAWGLLEPWPGLAEAWTIPCLTIRHHRRAYLVHGRQWLQAQCRTAGYRRVQAHVDAQDPRAQSLARHLGFAYEARLPQYGPQGEDFWLMAQLQPSGGW